MVVNGPWLLEAIGSMAAFCTTISLFPQLVRVLRRKSATDISFAMFAIFGLGVLSWFVYGVGVRSWPMMVGNGVTFTLAVTILALKLKYDRMPGRDMGTEAAAADETAVPLK
jgi:MtN3 and saliva related transmembrane protein